MYEHPIKRFGLSMNRIIYSNTKMVHAGFPKKEGINYMGIEYKYRTFSSGKAVTSKIYTDENLDEVLPSRHQE